AAEQLKRHVYSDKRLARLAVLLAAPADTVSRLLQLVSGGGDARYADTERRFQWILAGGEAFPVCRPAAGNPSFINSGDFPAWQPAAAAWRAGLSPEFPQCNWTELSSPCYDAALNYDYLLLSLLPLLSRTLEAWAANGTLLSVPFYGIFTDANYTGYSFSRGLYHRARGFSAPAVKMFNVQEVAGAKRLVKLGELLVDSAGDEARRSVTWQLGGPAAAKFYGLNASSGIVQEVPSLKSECSGVCPNCLGTSSGIVEFSPGDYYIGVIAPVRYPGNDRFYCSDGTLRGAREGGYQFALAVKFIL
uniref:Glyco_hydro_18 domain-containing protein n=1 Tax=Macrostomum lignano TaxID=282301 RepID=A0A1I8ITW7_9PLAT